LCGHAVHAVGRRADENLFAAGNAEGTDEGINGFVRADADEEVVGGEGLGGVGVGIAEVAELLFELYLMTMLYFVSNTTRIMTVKVFVRVWVSVQSK
jgi:hypothetical protein